MNYVRPEDVTKVGARFVSRYLKSRDPRAWKIAVTWKEIAGWPAGTEFLANFEDDNKGPGSGLARGVDAAHQAQDALDELSRDSGRPDFSVTPVVFSFADVGAFDMDAMMGAVRGSLSVVGLARNGLYGNVRAIDEAFRLGLITYAFQAYAWAAVPGPDDTTQPHPEKNVEWEQQINRWIRWHPDTQLRQIQNSLENPHRDDDVAVQLDFGQWPAPPSRKRTGATS